MAKRPPKYRHFKARNLGFVEHGGKRKYFVGDYGSDESLAAYRAFLTVIQCTPHLPKRKIPVQPILSEIAVAYLDFAEQNYPSGPRSTFANMKNAITKVTSKKKGYGYGTLLASEFKPSVLKDIQRRMITDGCSRRYVNDITSRIKTWIRWCVSEELIDPSVLHGLQSVSGVKRGSGAKEPKKRTPIEWRDIEPVFEFLQPPIAGMLWLQWFSGARSGSLCMAKPEQFEKDGDLLLWRPRHKTEHLGHEVILPLGPKCQEKIAPFLERVPDKFMFSPRESKRGRNRVYGRRYKPWTYRRSLVRAQDAAIEKARKENTYIPRKWTPHQIRRLRGNIVRSIFGVEGAQSTLGHESIAATQIYAGRQLELAKRIARELG